MTDAPRAPIGDPADAHADPAADAIAIVLLAAGGSTRFGSPKQLLPFRGRTLLRHAAEQAAASRGRPVVVVLGASADACAEQVADLGVRVVRNDLWTEGMASSIRVGLDDVDRVAPHADGVLLMLGDQPLVSTALIDSVIDARRRTRQPMAAVQYPDGALGVPAVFARACFDDLRRLTGASGAQGLLRRDASRVAAVASEQPALDVDTPEEYERLLRSVRDPLQ